MNLTRICLLITVFCTLVWPVAANTIYLVRHAEKQDSGADPALTVCGQGRAEALAAYFAEVKLQAVYSTGYQRTQQTVQPIAKNKQLTIQQYDPSQPELMHAQLEAHTGPVVVVGHSNTVPQLVTMLTGIEVSPLTEQDYTMLYQVELGESLSVTLRHQEFSCNQ